MMGVSRGANSSCPFGTVKMDQILQGCMCFFPSNQSVKFVANLAYQIILQVVAIVGEYERDEPWTMPTMSRVLFMMHSIEPSSCMVRTPCPDSMNQRVRLM